MTVEMVVQNWTEYDSRKRAGNSNARYFDSNADWEVVYLCQKLKSIYPFITYNALEEAIAFCAKKLDKPCTREVFAEKVIQRLGIPL